MFLVWMACLPILLFICCQQSPGDPLQSLRFALSAAQGRDCRRSVKRYPQSHPLSHKGETLPWDGQREAVRRDDLQRRLHAPRLYLASQHVVGSPWLFRSPQLSEESADFLVSIRYSCHSKHPLSVQILKSALGRLVSSIFEHNPAIFSAPCTVLITVFWSFTFSVWLGPPLLLIPKCYLFYVSHWSAATIRCPNTTKVAKASSTEEIWCTMLPLTLDIVILVCCLLSSDLLNSQILEEGKQSNCFKM